MEFIRKEKGARRLLAIALAVALVIPASLGLGVPKADADADGEITQLTANVNHESYQTWIDISSNDTPPPELIVTLSVTLSEDRYVSGGAIELPLNFTPT
ncbi:MAG: hypothetical protein LBS24_02565, partial [Clostridiales Family XIII bacterium]|nr:hypothetical protein [Clostridiales Family XIII bacterium]